MTDVFAEAIGQSFSRMDSGAAMDIEVGDDGFTRIVPKADITITYPRETQPTDQENPFAIAGEVTPMTPGEFAQKTGEVAAGAVGGAAASTLGLPGDIAGLAKGIYDAIGAEEGERLVKGLEGLAAVSDVIGSEAILNVMRDTVNALPIPEESKQNILAGSKYLGEFAEIPGGGALAMGGVAKLRQIADQADSQYMFPFDQLDQVTEIAPSEAKEFGELARQYRFTQPIESADDAVDLAKTNQQVLGRTGSSIAKKLGIKFKNPGIKGEADRGKRMAEKAQAKGGIRALSDITRGGFAVQTVEQADQVVAELAKKYKIIDEGFAVTDLGYFDRKLMVINKNGQIGEVQIWAEPMFAAKIEKGGQDLYTIFRGEKTPDQMDADELAAYNETIKKYNLQGDTHAEIVSDAKEKSVQLYADALAEASPDMRDIAVTELRRMVDEGGKEAETAQIMLDRLGEAAQ